MADAPFITIVSGLPRSGTSMMMQVIKAGGIQVLTDHIRPWDEDNPRGYYEFEPVKHTKKDASWIPGARGKVVKVIYRLLYDLPSDFTYRVVFMQRDLGEVLASQKKMLERSGRKGTDVGDARLKELFQNELDRFDKWIAKQTHFSRLDVFYEKMITRPAEEIERINGFLENTLDPVAAVSAVDPSLYHNRVSKG
ncbi:MAG: sulfotransferase [Deltaproteobacteria bacterium]|nr:sulfotransferase [Deltaproteobacteria bacterium]